LALGLAPSEVRRIAAKDYDLLAKYWKVEPWGSYRDNLHAGLIAREVRRPYLKDPTRNPLEDFMIVTPEERAAAIEQQRQQRGKEFVVALRSIAGAPRKEQPS
jgi:hypothetical protein